MYFDGYLKDIAATLKEQTSGVPKCYDLVRQINMASKNAIEALKRGEIEKVERFRKEMGSMWEDLGNVSIPDFMRWQFDADCGQEIVEFLAVEAYYPYIVGRGPKEVVPHWRSHMSISVPLQIWLSGLEDVVGELSKMLGDYLLQRSLTLEERIAARERFLEVAKEIYAFLSAIPTIERASDAVRNSGSRLKYPQTFRGKLGRVMGNIDRNQSELVSMLDRISSGGTT